MMFIARDVKDIADAFGTLARQKLREAGAEKGFRKRRLEGEAYGYEQAARTLRDLKWAHDVDEHGWAAPYAIPREATSAEASPQAAPGAASLDADRDQ
jgi:hypothetical protein